MPLEANGYGDVTPVYTDTKCRCPSRSMSNHESNCIHKPRKIEKPTPRAGKRAWRKYRGEVEHGPSA